MSGYGEPLESRQLDFIENAYDMDGQWQRSGPLFEHFFQFLRQKGYKPSTIGRKINCAIVFMMNYLYASGELESLSLVNYNTICAFRREYFKKMFVEVNLREERQVLKAIHEFFSFLHQRGLISRKQHCSVLKGLREKICTADEPPTTKEIAIYEEQ
jgi:hypothetical protein